MTTTNVKKSTYTQDFKQFNGATAKIIEVYPHELSGWFKTQDGRSLKKTYTQIPLHPAKELVSGGEELKNLPKYSENPVCEYREKVWDNGVQKFIKVEDQKSIDKKVFKKVYAIKFELPEAKRIVKYVKNGEEVAEENDTVTVTEIGAAKVKDLIRCFCDNIPMVQKEGNKDQDGEVQMIEVEAYGFEDEMKGELAGKFVKIKTVKASMEIDGETKQVTKFMFSEGKEFKKASIEDAEELF